MHSRCAQLAARSGFSLLELVCAIGFFAVMAATLTGLWTVLLTRLDEIRTRREALHIAELFEVYATCDTDFETDDPPQRQCWVYDREEEISLFKPSVGLGGDAKSWSVELLYIASELPSAPLYELRVLSHGKLAFQTLYGRTTIPQGF